MGEHRVKDRLDTQELQAFSRRLLDDLMALSMMIDKGMIESGVRRIGAEQEIFLVDRKGDPAMAAMPLLKRLNHPDFTTELARFNLECNLPPRDFGGSCLSQVEADIVERLAYCRTVAAEMDLNIVICGILPTLHKKHLTLDAMTPNERYYQLNHTLKRMRGGNFSAHIKGLDELRFDHDNILFEACNTSFQVHFQVAAEEFAKLYNIAQVVTGPVLAAACNSPLLLNHRLWRETRVALFAQSIDNRTNKQSLRGLRPRVSFGSRWVKESVLEIFKEDIARFRILLSTDADEDPVEVVKRGEAPKLSALRLHNGTVYRWNRPCYGIGDDGKAHLRIENRVIPAGPTPADELANAAFFFGLMSALGESDDDFTETFAFDHAKENFLRSARFGLAATCTWVNGKEYKVKDLIRRRLLPMAREGLQEKGIDAADIDRYLGIIGDRTKSGQTGAKWALSSLEAMGEQSTYDERARAIVLATIDRQKEDTPVHTWRLAALEETKDWRDSYQRVGQFMTTDLFTMRAEDLLDLAVSVMDWEHIRHVPVEDEEGFLVGIITMRDLLVHAARSRNGSGADTVSVGDIMNTELVTVSPDHLTVDALRLMRDKKVGCLPVVDEEKHLVGLITDNDLLKVAAHWMEEQLLTLA